MSSPAKAKRKPEFCNQLGHDKVWYLELLMKSWELRLSSLGRQPEAASSPQSLLCWLFMSEISMWGLWGWLNIPRLYEAHATLFLSPWIELKEPLSWTRALPTHPRVINGSSNLPFKWGKGGILTVINSIKIRDWETTKYIFILFYKQMIERKKRSAWKKE